MNSNNTTHSSSPPMVIVTGIASGFIVAFLDLFLALLLTEIKVTLPWTLPVSVLLICVLYWLVYAVFWIGLTPIRRVFKLETLPCAFALALSLGISMIIYASGLINFERLNTFYQTYATRTFVLAALLFVTWCIVLFVANYIIARFAYRSSYKKILTNILFTCCFILFGTLLLIIAKYVFAFGKGSLLFMAVSIFLAVGLASWLFRDPAYFNTQIKILYSLVVAFAAIGFYYFTTATSVIQNEYANEEQPKTIKKVILLTVDTLRRDALSHYQGQTSTPNLDKLASESIVFNKAFSSAPWTKPAMVSMLTGLSPCVHKSIDFYGAVPNNFPILSERLRSVGYATGSVGYNFFLSSKPEGKGLQKGISDDIFLPKINLIESAGMTLLTKLYPFETGKLASTDDITTQAVDWLKNHKDNNFFLWVHYFDPHVPYAPPEEFLPAADPHPRFGTTYWHHANPAGSATWMFDEDEVDWIKQLYLSEVRFVDNRIGKLIDSMKKLGIYDESLIIMSSDHGEEFMEHFGMDHGHSLYNELLEVPLTIKLPGSTKTGPVETQVTTTAISPTVLDLVGVPYDATLFSSGTLTPYWTSDTPIKPEPIYSSGIYLGENGESVIYDDTKYIRFWYTGREEMYQLDNDPKETENRIASSIESATEARNVLGKVKSQCKALQEHYQAVGSGDIEIDQQTRESLKSLGYMR